MGSRSDVRLDSKYLLSQHICQCFSVLVRVDPLEVNLFGFDRTLTLRQQTLLMHEARDGDHHVHRSQDLLRVHVRHRTVDLLPDQREKVNQVQSKQLRGFDFERLNRQQNVFRAQAGVEVSYLREEVREKVPAVHLQELRDRKAIQLNLKLVQDQSTQCREDLKLRAESGHGKEKDSGFGLRLHALKVSDQGNLVPQVKIKARVVFLLNGELAIKRHF